MVKVKILDGPHEGEIITMNGFRESFFIPMQTYGEWGAVEVEYKMCAQKVTGEYCAKISGISVNHRTASQLPDKITY